MADGKLPLSPASPGGQIEDVEQLNVPSPVPPPPGPGLIALVRQRVQTVGRLYNQIAAVLDADPAPAEFGLVTRGVNAAKETTLAAILAQLDVALSTRASEATLASILAGLVVALNVPLSTRASEVTAAAILAQLDVALSTRVADATITARLNTLGQKLMAASAPVVIASDQSAIPVSFTPSGTQDVNLTEVAGNAVTTQAAGEQLVAVEGRAADGAAVAGNPVLIAGQDGANAQSLLTDTSGRPNVVGAAAQGAAIAGNPVLIGAEDAGGLVQRLRTAALPPVGTTPGQVVRPVVSQTGTTTSVATSTANATLLAANTNRLGAVVYNDSSRLLYVKCGTTASTTDFTVRLAANEFWQVPFGYTGRIDGILNAGTGDARITEFT